MLDNIETLHSVDKKTTITTPQPSDQQLQSMAKRVIGIEAETIAQLSSRIDEHFVQACQVLLACTGRVVVTGMGKSGHIARKIAATLSSTGTPAFFMHPAEASHGDLGMITRKDVVIALSYSGNTHEILTILPGIKRFEIPFITLTGNPQSILAREADIHLDVSISQEACPLGLAPTASTTAALVMGDALAIALLDARGFTPEDFGLTHPAGQLGRKVLLKVCDLMHQNNTIPHVSLNATIREALLEMTNKRLGMTVILDNQQHIAGIYTDGDLRRTLDKNIPLQTTPITEVMTTNPKTISSQMLAASALNQMEKYKITTLIVSDDGKYLQGILHLHDVLQAGIA